MYVSKPLFTLALCLASSQDALGAPAQLDSRDIVERADPGDSESNPIKGTMNVDKQSRLAFDADCWAILCAGAPTVFRREDSEEADDNRKENGVSIKGHGGNGPFRNKDDTEVKVPPVHSSWSKQKFVSPEEFPFASTMQGGYNSFLIPVNQAAQNSQGGTINGFYRRHDIEENSCDSKKSWFTIDKWEGNLGPYCHALQHGSSQGKKDICKKGSKDAVGPWGFDVGEYAYKWDGGAYRPAGKNK